MAINSSLKFYPLTFVPEGEDIMVGRPDIDSYAAFPSDGVALLQQLQDGLAPELAAQWYQEQYGEPIDIEDFLATLRELGFMRDGDEAEAVELTAAPVSFQWLGRAAFSPVAWVIYALLCVYACYDMWRFPHLIPTYQNIFFSPYFTVVELGLFLGQFPGLFFHEAYHMLAGRRLGLPSRLGLGHRLYYVVFETALSGLWSVPRNARYLPYLAGMLADVLWFSLMTIIAGATMTSTGGFSPLGAFCAATAFATLLRLLWQFYLYLQTDLYYVFINATGCIDLQNTTKRYLRNRFYQLLKRPEKLEDETQWNPRDHQIARWYVFVLFAGYLFSIVTFLLILLPVSLQFLMGVFSHFFGGYALHGTSFWDSAIFLALNVLQLVVVCVLFLRGRRKRAVLAQA